MKKSGIIGLVGLFVFTLSSCGGGHICYMNSSNMTKDVGQHNKKVEMVQERAEKTK